MSTGPRYSDSDAANMINRLADLITNMEERIAVATASAEERVAVGQHVIDRQAELMADLRRNAAAAFKERDQALADLEQARKDLEQERRSTEQDRVACRAAIRERDEAISQRADALRAAEKTYKAYTMSIADIDRLTRERDQARADASAVGISSIDQMLGDMIDSALDGGAKLVVEYCPGHGDEPEDFGCFVAALTGPDDELVRDAIGDTAMEAVRGLRPMPEPGPTPDEQPF